MSGYPVPSPLSSLRRVRVGTTSEPKLAAVRSTLAAFAPDAQVEGVAVPSGVPEQPVGFEEIVRGARNRAARASETTACDLGIGLEDGLVALPVYGVEGEFEHLNIGCAAITDGERVAIGFSAAFAYPAECSLPAVRDREPIGQLFDRMWARRRGEPLVPPPGRIVGNVEKLTLGVLPRDEYARHAMLCALVPFLNPDLYDDRDEAE